jgi:hypothetical protein
MSVSARRGPAVANPLDASAAREVPQIPLLGEDCR